MKNTTLVSAVAAATFSVPFLGGIAEAASLVVKTIDPLTTDQTTSGNAVGTFSGTQVGFTSDLLGAATRDMDLNVTATVGQFADASIPVGPGDAGLSISNGTNVKSNTDITYGFTGPVDFTMGGADRFIFNIQTSDFAGTINVIVNGVSQSIAYPALADNQPVELLYSAFGTNLAAVTSFAINVDTPGGSSGLADVTFDYFATGREMPMGTPEPATILGLLAFGGAGLVSRRRRQK